MIKLIYPRMAPLGDRITAILYAHMLSVKENQKVKLISQLNEQMKISKMIPFGDVEIDPQRGNPNAIIDHIPNREILWRFVELSKEFPNTISTYDISKDVNRKPQLPKRKFITVQWDAQQSFRCVDKEKIQRIEQSFKDQGYSVIRLEGKRVQSWPLESIWYVLSKAEYHVGVDSGMMHMARLILPPEKIHIYVTFKDREDGRTPDNKNVTLQTREMIRRGAKLNPIDNLDKETIEYYSHPEIFIGYKKEDYVKPSN